MVEESGWKGDGSPDTFCLLTFTPGWKWMLWGAPLVVQWPRALPVQGAAI